MNLAIQVVGALSVVIYPFMHGASSKLRELLELPKLSGRGELEQLMTSLAEGEEIVKAGHKIGEAKHLFTKVEDEVIATQKANLVAPVVSAPEAEQEEKPKGKATIQYDDFVKLDMRVATIRQAEVVPKTDKLLKLTLDVGGEERTVVSGIAEHYSPNDIIGQQVTLLANLAPRKLRGILSEGMILMAEDGAGKLSFVAPDKVIDSGSSIS